MVEVTQPSSPLPDSLNAGPAEQMADLLRHILSQVGEGILVINTACEVVFMNEAAAQLLGTSEAPPSGDQWSSFYGFFLPDAVTPYPAGQTPLMQALRGRSFDGAQFFIRNRNVTGRWLSATTRPLRNREGEIWGAVSVFRDITPEKRAAETLRESEQRFRALFEDNSAGIVLSSVEGGIVEANDAFARMIGYSRIELVCMRMQQLYFDAADRDRVVHSLLVDGQISGCRIGFSPFQRT